MKNSTNLSNKVFFILSIIFVFVATIESLRVAVAIPQLISSGTTAPANDLQDIEAVYQADLQAKKMAETEAVHLANKLTQANIGKWDLSSSRMFAVGVGAAIGVVAINYITGGTLSTTAAAPALAVASGTGIQTAAVASTGSTLVGVYALIGAMVGGIAGNYLYDKMQSPDDRLTTP